MAAWFNNFDMSERLFLEVDRRDLAVAMRKRLGDWFKVVQLLKSGGMGNDTEMEEAWNHIGNYYSERHQWQEAVTYYEKARKLNKAQRIATNAISILVSMHAFSSLTLNNLPKLCFPNFTGL